MKKLFGIIVTLFFAVSFAWAAPENSARLAVHLLDYVAKDYGGAVQDGKVVSASEFHEQEEFARKAREAGAQLKLSGVEPKLQQVCDLIARHASPDSVAQAAHEARSEIIRLTGIETTPPQTPDLAQGAKIFSARCAACHGVDGYGNGPAAASLNPKPVNFHDPQEMKGIAPLQAFHAVRLGVPGTAMAPLGDLSDQDSWNVAYFALSLGGGGKGGGGGDSVSTIRSKLHSARDAFQNGKFEVSQELALAAYLEGFEPLEPKLKANDAELVGRVEEAMARVRASIDHREPLTQVDAEIRSANSRLDEVEAVFARQEMSPGMAFTAAAAVLLREGFEAVLVVLAFLGVVRTSGSRRGERWLHGGWIAAVALGVVAWFFSGWLLVMSGAQREAMEAVTAFFAAAVLLFVGFWLHQKTEITRWKKFVEGRVKAALEEKSLWGLASISFIAVFRETLETVLFLRAIWIDCGPHSRTALLAGVIVSFAGTLALAWAAMKFTRRVPIRQLFMGSSFLMALLAVIFVGKGVHSFQETGTLAITNLPFALRWELFGVFPTWESFAGQLLVVGLILLLWLWGKRTAEITPRAAQQ